MLVPRRSCVIIPDSHWRYQVVQYILDLNDNRFSDGVIRQFTGNVCALSVQKFSSNVIEKVRFFRLYHRSHANWD
jgi:hypothetical protein